MPPTTEKTAPSAPASPTLDGVLEKGEDLRERVHGEVKEHRETYRRNAGGRSRSNAPSATGSCPA